MDNDIEQINCDANSRQREILKSGWKWWIENVCFQKRAFECLLNITLYSLNLFGMQMREKKKRTKAGKTDKEEEKRTEAIKRVWKNKE